MGSSIAEKAEEVEKALRAAPLEGKQPGLWEQQEGRLDTKSGKMGQGFPFLKGGSSVSVGLGCKGRGRGKGIP